MSYSKDLRERAVKYYKSGHTLKETSGCAGRSKPISNSQRAI